MSLKNKSSSRHASHLSKTAGRSKDCGALPCYPSRGCLPHHLKASTWVRVPTRRAFISCACRASLAEPHSPRHAAPRPAPPRTSEVGRQEARLWAVQGTAAGRRAGSEAPCVTPLHCLGRAEQRAAEPGPARAEQSRAEPGRAASQPLPALPRYRQHRLGWAGLG